MLSSKTIKMAIEALTEDLNYIDYSIKRGDITGTLAQRGYIAARKGITEYEIFTKAITELEEEYQKAVERENAKQA